MQSANQDYSKIFAIGDVHGCADELVELLGNLPLDDQSLVVFLGDLVDRGPKSKEVIDHILKLKEMCQVVAISGNHEAMFLSFLDHPESIESILFIMNGGLATLDSYADENSHQGFSLPKEHEEFLRQLPDYAMVNDFVFVHAGLPKLKLPDCLAPEYREDRLWLRNISMDSSFDWGKKLIHGHSPTVSVEIHKNRINLDTGCVFGLNLTAMELVTQTLYQVKKASLKSSNRGFWPKSTWVTNKPNLRAQPRFAGKIPVSIVGVDQEFTTLNYNEIGLLLRQTSGDAAIFLNQFISGVIGREPLTQILFLGEVVRIQSSAEGWMYGVKVLKLNSP